MRTHLLVSIAGLGLLAALAGDGLAGPPAAAIAWPINDGTRPYWAQREAQNEARLRLGSANVLLLGDSILDNFTNGVGLPVWKQYFAPIGAANFAVGGITTRQVLWQVRAGQVAGLRPKVVILLVGTNNLGLGQSPADTATAITTIVGEIGAQLPNTRILLLGVLPRGQTPADPLRSAAAQVNARIARLADGRRVRYLDPGAALLQPNGTIAPQVMPDFLHPSLAGYRMFTTAIWPTLQAALQGN
jgi:beta-glucosidase